MIELAWPYVIAVLPLPLLIALLAPRASHQPRAALRVPFFAALEASTSSQRAKYSRLRLLLAAVAWILLVMAASRPQFVGEPLQLPVSGRDLLLAVDISKSMDTDDMLQNREQVNRLQVVKEVAGDFIERRAGDRIGLILFGERAYLQTPLTFDRATVRTLLFEAEVGLAGNATAIGDAIGLAVKRLRNRPEENRVLILLTDGANTAGEIEPLRAAEIAAREGLRIYTIGIGADEMLVRDFLGAHRINPSADLDERTLTAIAEMTGGRYFRARDTADLTEIYALLDALEPSSTDEKTFRPVKELYPWPLAAALLITFVLTLAAAGLPRPGWTGRREEAGRAG